MALRVSQLSEHLKGTFFPVAGSSLGSSRIRRSCGKLARSAGSRSRSAPGGCGRLRAIDFVYSETERRHFEKRSIFFEARATGRDSRRERDHELRWLTPEEAIAELTHPSQSEPPVGGREVGSGR
jgi:hypothetical protein